MKEDAYTPKRRIYIWDETLRDGEQSPGVRFTKDEKVLVAKMLDDAGVYMIDAGFPASSEEERKCVRAIMDLGLRAQVGVTARAKKEDIDAAISCGVTNVFAFMPASDLHLKKKFGISREEAVRRAENAVDYGRGKGLNMFYIAEDTARADSNYVIEVFNRVYEAGANLAMICDTVGVMDPFEMYSLVKKLREGIPSELKLGIHCHGDFGLATANTYAAIKAGVDYPTLTVNGIGERAGNAALEEVVMLCEKKLELDTGMDTTKLFELSREVERCSGMIVAPNKAIVGYNAFRHESGIHTDGVLKDVLTYEPIQPEAVGQKRELVVGKHAGRKHVEHVLQMGAIPYTPDDAAKFLDFLRKQQGVVNSKKRIRNRVEQVHEFYRNNLGISNEQVLAFWETFKSARLS